ncbi:MAG: hypothetical protein LBE67_12395 [Kocuria palustris]|jgi:hypothetical protein|uniref:hypothetical protein n=1 Tax=Kocuria palustris TaxID=71999 RepID=UPI001E1A52AA|nr:hypothetical protein [Kocuria palustris]MBZ6375764.1 hypothetical protein [Kocuria palustris]
MSLLTNPRHELLVQRYGTTTDDEGVSATGPLGDPILVRGNVHQLSAEEAVAYGVQATETYMVTARNWPGDHRTRVFWDGRWWDQIGEPARNTMSPRTAHERIRISARTPRAADTEEVPDGLPEPWRVHRSRPHDR